MIGDSRRSVLYVPADSEKMLKRSAGLPADLLLLNLEDGVAVSKKDLARDTVVRALKDMDFGRHEIVIRVNSPNSDIGRRDLAAVVPLKPDGICLPKVERRDEVLAVDGVIRELETLHGIPDEAVRLHAMIESAPGVLHSAEIAAGCPRVASLIFGSADYVNDIRCRVGEDRQELLLALQAIVLACRAAGIDAIDAPCFDIRNSSLLYRESVHARNLGFDGKSALHPGQIEIINRVFDVSSEEIAWAERVVAELDAAEQRGKALSTLDGSLIDNPHRAAAQRILRRNKNSNREVFTDSDG